VVLGKDTAGHPAFTDLARAPHLLIAGQTGSGKSVCINTILTSLLFSQSPERLRMILIDPKVVELSTYSEIPHLMAPVITKPEEAVQALKWTAVEMDRRYEVLAAAGTRNIAGFNDKMEAGTLPETVDEEDRRRMPYLLLIIDEFADLMMVAGKEVETNVARIAQKARAVGIHMILATQRPSTNVITGVIKANLPTRIAFQVASQIDARTIMEHQGAEDLLGRGDMLFRGIEAPEPMRVHGAFVSDAEAEAAALSASSQGVVFPMVESFDLGGGDEEGDEGEAPVKFDAKFGEAARLVAMTRQGSVSMLQRRLEVGFARAGRLMDQLERMGIVGRDRGSKAREVLMDEVQVEDLCRRLEEGY
jgi:DNA segregation ATPase FtsK/SpoIIIE, S-DNA-T family